MMTEQRHQELIQRCCAIFRHETQMHFNHHIADLAAYIILEQAQDSLNDILQPIIQTGALPHDLLRALTQCQLLVLQHQTPHNMDSSAEQQVQSFQDNIEHFHFIANSILSIGKQTWLTHIESKQNNFKAKHESRIIEAAIKDWQTAGKIKCLNYYKGLPVQAIVPIEHIHSAEKVFLSLKLSKDLTRVLAIADQHYVLAPGHNDMQLIELMVQHIGENSITFHVHTLSLLKKRQHFRLQPLQHMDIQLQHHKKSIAHGQILNFSLGHMDVILASQQGLELNPDEIIDIQFHIKATAINGSAWIRSIRQDKQQCFLCLELIPNAIMQRLLQQEIAYLQRTIIREIKEKFTPISDA